MIRYLCTSVQNIFPLYHEISKGSRVNTKTCDPLRDTVVEVHIMFSDLCVVENL